MMQTVFPLEYKAPPPKTKQAVLKRDKHTCQICLKKSIGRKLEIHHKVAIRKGGSHDFDNLITICKKCHKTIEPSRKLNYAVKATIGMTIKVRESTFNHLAKLGKYGDSMDDIISRLIWEDKEKEVA